nr:cation acetate symporter [Kibdelosporangium sp. MJ126-NF4]CEL13118.1 Putative symporter YjcG [Kibdelosporangium sp. MJ126-NF4]CTQ98806.1 Putative symporter YjcG [Kibdelosporangium sp. MJ126-NF4]
MIFVLVILFVVSRFGRAGSTRSDFYVGDRTFTASQNGLALFGTFLMMTPLLALSGEIALDGYDGVMVTAGFAVSWLVTLLLVAEPLRNTGEYTLGDTLSVRMTERPVRVAASAVTLVVLFCYMTIQLAGAGGVVSVLLNVGGPIGQAVVIATIGGITAAIVYYGGMRGTTWTQVIKAVLLVATLVALAGAVLVHYRFNVSALLGDATARSPDGERLLQPGPNRLEFVSHLVTTVLGNAALPCLLVRFLTVPSAKHARRSVTWAICLSMPCYLLVILIGLGAAALIGPARILAAPGQHFSTVVLLASELGGVALLAFIASVVFTTTVAVTAGLVITAAASFARDIYANKGEPLDERREITVARRAVIVLCVLLTVVAILLMNQSVTFMLSLAVTLAASSILPTLLFSWLWRGFNTVGTLWCMYGGAAVTIILVVFSPAVSGDPAALLPAADFAFVPWKHVGLLSIPASFLLGYAGAKCSAERDDGKYAEMDVRALTGAGAEEARPRPDDSGR